MTSITASNGCNLVYSTATREYEFDNFDYIKEYLERESPKKPEETAKKEPMIDHRFLEEFERIMKKDIPMRKKAAQLVDKVIVNEPALIVFWKNGSKTVVKCTNEEFDLEKGIAMAFIKRVFGNKGNYNAFLNFIIMDYYPKLTHFCPDCGAKMEGKANE